MNDYGEPWRVEKYGNRLQIFNCENHLILEYLNPSPSDHIYFNRIVACVNTCAGIENPLENRDESNI